MPFSILCVEDEQDLSSLVRFHLEHAGFLVETAETGRAAIQSVSRHRPDLILLDLMLPDIDGFGVCEILRRSAATATIPIVMVTAWASNDARDIGLELGALDYVRKPFSPNELVNRVQRLLALSPGHPG